MDDAKPPIIPGQQEARSVVTNPFPRQAAMFSLAAPFVGIGVNLVTTLVARGNRWALLIGGLGSIVLIVSGFVLGISALVSNRKSRLEGVTPRAVGGVCISGFLILLMAAGLPGLLRAVGKARERQRQPIAPMETSRESK
jgi:hypothetical protein